MKPALHQSGVQDPPAVSVVMPSFNQSQFLGAAIKSVLQQSFKDLELIVCDGGSTDGSQQVLERLSKQAGGRLRWYSERDEGAADAINKALRLARGDVIGWLNSDDLYSPQAVERALHYFNQRPETIMVYGIGEHIDEAGANEGRYPSSPPPLTTAILRASCPICQPTVFFRREMLGAIGMLDPTLSVSFDYDLWVRAFTRFPYQIGFVDAVQAYSRLHASCKTMRQRRDVALESMRVTARGLGSAGPHWIYSWLDEFFDDYPFGGQAANGREVLQQTIDEARSYLSAADQISFDERLRGDARIRVMHDDAYIGVHTDGWAAPDAVLRVRAVARAWRLVRLKCRHAAPGSGTLRILVTGPDNSSTVHLVDSGGDFTIEFSLPPCRVLPAYWSFTFTTEGGFVPAKSEPNSRDNRELAFLVNAIELEE